MFSREEKPSPFPEKTTRKFSISPRSKCRYFSIICSCTANGKMGENQIWDGSTMQPTTQYAHTALMQFRKCDFTAAGNLVSNPFGKDGYQPGFHKIYVSCLLGQYQGPSRAPSFPVARSFSQWEEARPFVGSQWSCYPPWEPSTFSRGIKSYCVHFCRILSISVRLVWLPSG